MLLRSKAPQTDKAASPEPVEAPGTEGHGMQNLVAVGRRASQRFVLIDWAQYLASHSQGGGRNRGVDLKVSLRD